MQMGSSGVSVLQRGEGEGEDQARRAAQQSDKVGYCFTVGQSLRRTAQQNAVRPPRPFPLLPLLLKRRLCWLAEEGGGREPGRDFDCGYLLSPAAITANRGENEGDGKAEGREADGLGNGHAVLPPRRVQGQQDVRHFVLRGA